MRVGVGVRDTCANQDGIWGHFWPLLSPTCVYAAV